MQTFDLKQIQLARLNQLIAEVWGRNPFYTQKWCEAGVSLYELGSLRQLAQFPFTTRSELIEDQTNNPPLGTNLTCPPHALKRVYRSSGTSRAPLFWADTPQTWESVMRASQALYVLAGLKLDDRLFFTLPFGSSGPWIMFEGACRLGCGCFNGRGASPEEQLLHISAFQPTVLVGKPDHLRSLANASAIIDVDPRELGVRKLILTGESASPELRMQLQYLWKAECFDRYGLTEAGPVASECCAHAGGMHLLESELVAELIHPETLQPLDDGELGELVLTTLGRFSRPVIRYRTGDLVRLVRQHVCPCGRQEALLMGGVRRAQITPHPASTLLARQSSTTGARPQSRLVRRRCSVRP